MTVVYDPELRRFWFPVLGHFGIGVTANSPQQATALAIEVATRLGWSIFCDVRVDDVDIRSLDQHHVIPNMGPPNFLGVWYPRENLQIGRTSKAVV